MRRTHLSKWGHAVLAGASLGILSSAPAASAQSAASRYDAAPVAARVPVDASTIRRGEFECALLADPMTFPYPVQAVFHDNTLELHGNVPSLAVRERVLTLARSVHSGAISDRLVIEISAARRLRSAPANVLHPVIMQRLRAAFPEHVANIAVHCDDRGNVVISGAVPTWTEKRTIHQTLRDTPGLTSLTNRLQLTAAGPTPAFGSTQEIPGGIVQAGGVPATAGGIDPLASARRRDADRRIDHASLSAGPQSACDADRTKALPDRARGSRRGDRQPVRRAHLQHARAEPLSSRRRRQLAETVTAIRDVRPPRQQRPAPRTA